MAAGGAKGEIYLWRVAEGQKILTVERHAGCVRSVAFSPDAKTLPTGSSG